jgi:DNA-binding helix-hairpin-helix protein with protein kinase domain
MSLNNLDALKQQIATLSRPEQLELSQFLARQVAQDAKQSTQTPELEKRERDRQLRAEWFKLNSAKYAGLYVALDGDRLLGTGKNYPEAYEAAQQAGVKNAYVDYVYPVDYEGEMGGW